MDKIMTSKKDRKWARSRGLFHCWILPHQTMSRFCKGAVINISQGGLLIETDIKLIHGDRMTIIHQNVLETEDLKIDHDIHGTVRWGLGIDHSLMGLYYYGIELDEILPLKRAATNQGASLGLFQIFTGK